METVIAYTDGGARGNPGPAGLGVYIVKEDGTVLKEVSKYLGNQTNNHAEYEAVLTALKTLRDLFHEKTTEMRFEIRLDSELIERQMKGIYKVKSPTLKVQYEEIQSLIKKHFPYLGFTHVRREYNKDADRLANEAMDRKS